MIKAIFNNVLILSKQSIIVFFAVLIIRLLLNKAPKKYSYYLLFIVFVKLVIPSIGNTDYSIYQFTGNINTKNIIPITSIAKGQIQVDLSNLSKTSINVNGFYYVWIIGFLMFAMYLILSKIKLSRKLKFAVCYQDYKDVKLSEEISVPFTYGLFRPTIYLPTNLSNNQVSQILIHERIHIRRKDNIVKYFSVIILAVYWFNPLVWLSYYMMSLDMELSCDESVILEHNIDRKEYGENILSFVNNQNMYISGFSQGNTKRRIMNILNCKKHNKCISIICILVICLICVILFTSKSNSIKYIEISKNELSITSPIKEGIIICDVEGYEGHTGIDIKDKYWESTEVYPCADGIIDEIGNDSDGDYIVIKHDNEYTSSYHGLVDVNVQLNQAVTSNFAIAKVKISEVNKHLHFEIQNEKHEYVKNIIELLN